MSTSTSTIFQYVRRPESKSWFGLDVEKDRTILPPSIGHGEGSAGHRIASSFAALQRTLKLPSKTELLASTLVQIELRLKLGKWKDNTKVQEAIHTSAFANYDTGNSKTFYSIDWPLLRGRVLADWRFVVVGWSKSEKFAAIFRKLWCCGRD